MIKTELVKDIARFKTGEEIEKEFNRIILLAKYYEISHIEANSILEELFNYGSETGKFTKEEVKSYIDRKNCHKDGTPRTHLEFAFNLQRGQKKEHGVFLYLIEWLKKNIEEEISWELNGSDLDGYIMIVHKDRKKTFDPDYRVSIDTRKYLVEAKSFYESPSFKIINLRKYKICKAIMIVKYDERYYLFKKASISDILKKVVENKWNQKVIHVDQNYIDELIEKDFIKEIAT
jgi:hypothetical protein